MQSVGTLDRKSYLGGSDVAAILGISPWRTPLDVFLDKTVGRQPEDPSKSKIFKRGMKLEPYILDMLEEDTGLKLVRRGERYVDPEHGFLAAEIDAEAETGENVEAKSVNQFGAKAWGNEWTDDIPVYYTAQAMHGMMITGAQRTIFPVLIGIDDFRIYKVERDQETIDLIRAKEVEFWQRIASNDPPEATTVGDLDRLFPWDKGTIIQATDDIRDQFNHLKQLKKKLKVLESDVDEVAKQIKLFMGEHKVLNYGAEKLATYSSQSADRFDINLFREKHPSIATRFIKTTNSRVLQLK